MRSLPALFSLTGLGTPAFAQQPATTPSPDTA
jgi:hypothetical protein